MKRRRGFTMVEMLVATALTLFLMVIISEAFVTALDTFTQLKAIGDMEEGLRTATINLRYDLSQNHFEGERRLSDPTIVSSPIQLGFLEIYQGAQSWPQDGYGVAIADNDLGTLPGAGPGAGSLASPPPGAGAGLGVNGSHVLHFTVCLNGSRPENVFSATIPNGSPLAGNTSTGLSAFGQLPDALYTPSINAFNSQWAEVTYFLYLTGSTTNPNDPTTFVPGSNTPLYGLFRSQLVIVPQNNQVNNVAGTSQSNYLNVACTDSVFAGGNLYFFTPSDMALGWQKRTLWCCDALQPNSLTTLSPNSIQRGLSLTVPNNSVGTLGYLGATRVLSNVVSFDVQVLTSASASTSDFQDLIAAYPTTAIGAGAGIGPAAARYDTASPPGSITALQISIRVWDPSTKQSRQITIVQAM